MKFIKMKKAGSGSPGYLIMFITALVLVVITLYMAQVSRLMTQQHHVDDSLADAVLASLIVDDFYYFQSYLNSGNAVVKLRSTDESHSIFVDCMNDAISQTSGFYYNFEFDSFICYEVEGDQVTVTSFIGNDGTKSVVVGRLGEVLCPKGTVVTKTSAYGKVVFDIRNVIDQSFIRKSKDIYCALEIN